jgi:phosphate transport system ATP-binding protein
LMFELKKDYTIVIVTHNMQQAARVADRTAFFTVDTSRGEGSRVGTLVEHDVTDVMFSSPSDQRTLDYVTGKFG